MRLTLAGRKLDRLEAAARASTPRSSRPTSRARTTAHRLVAEHLERHGGLDVLVNSAGVGIAGSIADTTTRRGISSRRSTSAAPSSSPGRRCPSCASHEGPRGQPRVDRRHVPTPGLAAYGAAKAALIALTRSLAREEADNGVRATALCPGFVDTPMAEWTGIPAEEMITPGDCAEIVRALLRLSPAARVPVVVLERAGDTV